MTRQVGQWLAPCAPALLLGCALARSVPFAEPSVRLTEVQITGIGTSGGTLNLVLAVHNPNGYQLRGTRADIGVQLERTDFGEATLDRPLVLPAGDTTVVEVPVRFTWEGVGAGARALLRTGSVSYTLRGTLRVDTPLGERPVTLTRGGIVGLRDLVRR